MKIDFSHLGCSEVPVLGTLYQHDIFSSITKCLMLKNNRYMTWKTSKKRNTRKNERLSREMSTNFLSRAINFILKVVNSE